MARQAADHVEHAPIGNSLFFQPRNQPVTRALRGHAEAARLGRRSREHIHATTPTSRSKKSIVDFSPEAPSH
jgi:hypothetical protein